MNTRILTTFVLLLVVSGTIARQCYQCVACPKPFKGNTDGVTKIEVGDNNYCYKGVLPLVGTETRGDGGANCNPIDKSYYCCKGNLCNGATTSKISVQLLAGMASLFFAVRFFQ